MIEEIDFLKIKENFPPRDPNSHKGTYGTLACICGSVGFAGAATLAIRAALRCGVGLTKGIVPAGIYEILATSVPESIFLPAKQTKEGTLCRDIILDLEKILNRSTACLIGCGLGPNEDTKQIVYHLIKEYERPLVVDADGINVIAENIDILKTAKSEIILTPHPGEMARLLRTSVQEIEQNREKVARFFASKYDIVLVLKGHETIVAAPGGNLFVNKIGNPGMATAGSGDVLAGMISSFVAQGMSAIESAKCGVYLHAASGDRCKSKLSERSMLASDMIEEIPSLFLNM